MEVRKDELLHWKTEPLKCATQNGSLAGTSACSPKLHFQLQVFKNFVPLTSYFVLADPLPLPPQKISLWQILQTSAVV